MSDSTSSSEEQKAFINYVKEAFRLPVNLAFMTVAVVVNVAFMMLAANGIDLIPWQFFLFLSAGLETLYLSLMPRNKRFIRAVNSRHLQESEQVARQLETVGAMRSLSDGSLNRYLEFHRKKDEIIRDLSTKRYASEVFLESQLDKLDAIEYQFVNLLKTAEQLDIHLGQKETEEINAEITRLKAEMKDAPGKVRRLHEKRLKLVQKRKHNQANLGEQLAMARVQLDTIEDTLNYLLDQRLVMQHPEEVTEIIDSLVEESDMRYETAQELKDLYGTGSSLSGMDELDEAMELGESSSTEASS